MWEDKQGALHIKHGGPTPGCVVVGLVIIGLGLLSLGILLFLDIITLPFEGYHPPIAIFTGCFGVFWLLAAINSRRNSVESIVVIDSFNNIVKFRAHTTDPETTIPFHFLQAVILHETVVEDTSYKSINDRTSSARSNQPRKSYDYRLYLQKRDGSIFWLDTFHRKSEAQEHLQLVLSRIEISCIDEAGGAMSRTLANPYSPPAESNEQKEISRFFNARKDENGDTEISIRYERLGVGGYLGAIFIFALMVGCPVWFFISNVTIIPGWFLIIPGVFLAFILLAIFMRGRRYAITCTPTYLLMSVRFWFPLFQMLFGKSARIRATALRAVRVNRYDGGDLHLEVAVDKGVDLPRLTRAAFNSGAIRRLPRAVTDVDLKHLGLWSILPLAKKGAGPTMLDLLEAESMIQNIYDMNPSIA